MNDFLSPALLRDKVQEWLDQRVEIVLSHLLRSGVLLAAVVVIAGAVLYLRAHARSHVDYHTFHAEPEQHRGVHTIFHAALEGQASGIMQLGLLLLIATPIPRVVLARLAASRRR